MSTTFWIQFIGTLFGVAMVYFTFLKYKKKELNKVEFMVWFLAWIVFIIVAIIPTVLDPLVESFNFYRRLDFFVVLGFFALLGLGFYNYSIVKKMERKIEVFVRNEAIRNHRKK